ncbi:glycosyltransferase family 4 protein [Allochromatium humboldtianum]|uniref:Glycosyltransferase family 4 protein n=1 Tax=Allochromatium humboldtianum TaxID=504901 RepID=A0A850R7V4_9GAMM|nr:glycosyltransferase family 1 protein [Allochromatium humboldtianum]NVZ10779.1 glycosyltransferase family 4 protein [Allochromatium humboldtianum]
MGIRLILDIDAIRHPLTGIGRYAYELARGLNGHPLVSSARFMGGGRWVEPPSPDDEALTAGPDGESRSSLTMALATRLASISPIMAGYRQWRSLLAWRRLSGFSDHLYHSPNYFLPPCSGPAVATIHDLSVIRYPQFHPAERRALFEHEWPRTLARAQYLITDSESIRREVIEHCGWPADRIGAIPLGVGRSFHPRSTTELASCVRIYGLTPDAYCLCVATIEPRKNITGLIEAHARLPVALQHRFPLLLIGARGWNSAAIHERIEAARSGGTLRYLEYVDQSDLPCLIAGARLFVFPSFYEGFGLPPLEAMACGVPLVTSTCPTLSELVQGVALQVDPLDIDALRQAMQRGLEDDTWRREARAMGLKRAAHYTWGACVEQTIRLYGRVSDGHH